MSGGSRSSCSYGVGGVTPVFPPRTWGSLGAPSLLSRSSPPVGLRFRARIRLPRIIPVGKMNEGGTYLCPAWAIKHRIPHLVYTSAYEGDD